jgi:hypothetical protein
MKLVKDVKKSQFGMKLVKPMKEVKKDQNAFLYALHRLYRLHVSPTLFFSLFTSFIIWAEHA